MSFEIIQPRDSEDKGMRSSERQFGFDERLGGPLKPNHLLTAKPGLENAKPILERLKVQHRISLYTSEVPLDEANRAFAPAEYRIEIMDPVIAGEPAAEAYVRSVYAALKEAGIPISKGASQERN